MPVVFTLSAFIFFSFRQRRPNDLSILPPWRDIHLIEIKSCEDTRPHNQLSAAQEQHKGLCSILQRASVTLHTILLGVGALSTTITCWGLLMSWVLILKELRNLLPSFMFTRSVNYASKLVHTRRALSSTIINYHQRRFQVRPATLRSPLIFSFLLWWRSSTVLGTKVAPFP
jgi:hypothetical protein